MIALLVFAVILTIVCFHLSHTLYKTKAAQKELDTANQEMKAGIKAKGEFLVNMSHSIRTPMNALTSFTEILTQRVSHNYSVEFKEETEGILDIIRKSSRDLLTTVNDVLDYIKIDANMLEIESVPMSIKQVIHDVCQAEKPNVIAKHLDLSIKYNGDIPPLILSDPVRIRQILSNLINNAVKFTEKGTIVVMCEVQNGGHAGETSEIPASASEAEESFSASSVQLKISVIDTGVGIMPAQMRELFKPFKQISDSSALQRHRGARLGLSIAMRLATLMDGTLEVESVPGQGSTFSLCLNTYIAQGATMMSMSFEPGDISQRGSRLLTGFDIRIPEQSQVAASDQNAPLCNRRILVVEDMVVNQVIITTLLRDAGALVEIADNGAMGVQKVLQDMDNGLLFDVVLMDMQMPIMDGYEATIFLRKHGYTRPIVAVTAHALTGDREKTLKAGCNDFIAKPIENSVLIDVIKKYAD